MWKVVVALSAIQITAWGARRVCTDYRVKNWYNKRVHTKGLPPRTNGIDFLSKPKNVSICELQDLHSYCVEQINKYRQGELKFSDGSDDERVLQGLSPLREAPHINRCSSEAAMGDLHVNIAGNPPGGSEGCLGGHENAFVCEWKGQAKQNACCARGGLAWGAWDRKSHQSAESIRTALDACLRQMWDEGIKPEEPQGHWHTMRSQTMQFVSCGFAVSETGRLWMTQDFTKALDNPDRSCSCKGKKHRRWDGCGRRCREEGDWYCRKLGSGAMKFTRESCSLVKNCTAETSIRARCCHTNAGSVCSRKEKLQNKQCFRTKPMCLT